MFPHPWWTSHFGVRLSALFVVVLVAHGCAAGSGANSRSSTSEITRADIVELDASDAYRVVQRLRPRWLRSRGVSSFSGQEASLPRVFVDGLERGPIDELRRISASDIEQIEFISSANATTQFGTGYLGGIIMVSTRR